jgi:hypothetical protein
LIYACNLGFPKIVKNEARADDFLSIFAHIDIFGSSFKTKGGKDKTPKPKKPAMAKIFSSERYSYQSSTYAEARKKLGQALSYYSLKGINKNNQLIESDYVRELVGKEGIKSYLLKKKSVGVPIVTRLESLAKIQKTQNFKRWFE